MRNSPEVRTPSARAQTITRRTYSRPLEGGGFETWDDIVGRVISHQRWLWQRALGDRPLDAKQENELEELREVLLARSGSVSGRTLWLGGTEVAKRREASMFNCLAGETTVITRDCGAVPLAKALGAREVLNSYGDWVSAEIKSFGMQNLAAYRFGHNSHSFTVYATAEHRWRLSSGEFVQGKYLNVGDKIPFVMPARQINDPVDYKLGVQHGLIYGDGSGRIDGTYIIRLCSDAEDLLPWFNDHSVTYPPSANGDPLVYISKKDAWGELKKLPTPEKSDSYLIGFIRGWLAADGSVSKAGQVMLCAGPQEEDWLRQWGAKFGYYCAGSSLLPTETNFGIRNKESRNIRLMKASVLPDDFIIKRKAARVNTIEMEYTFYGVDRSQPIRYEEVFCAVVPSTQDFVLGNGMLTGNCAFTKIETTHDVVDAFWLLLQGCGVGFEPVVGTLNGFTKPMEIEVVRSQRHLLEQKKGRETNAESYTSEDGKVVWTISVGDSAEAWAKSVGKMLAGKRAADVLRLDFSQIRPSGQRLKGYGWISSGDETFAPAMQKIAEVLNARAGSLLTRIDILDILNHLGTTLSSRRSAEIALVPYGDVEWEAFATAKKDFWVHNNFHRQQSNNSLTFHSKPTRDDITDLFVLMQASGGSEPGFINFEEGKRRAPWMSGVNPCVPGDTLILTSAGHVPISERVGKETKVWNGEQYSTVTPFSTGVNPLVEVVLSDGTSLKCTPYHKWVLAGGVRVMAEELQVGDRLEKFAMPIVFDGKTYQGDAYSQGFYSGDGNAGYNFSYVYAPKYEVIPRLQGVVGLEEFSWERRKWQHGPMLHKNFVPVDGTFDYCLNWLAGVLDADGTVTRDANGNGLQLTSVDKEFLLNVRLMLTRLGVRAKVVKGHEACVRLLPNGLGGLSGYACQTSYRLLIGNTDTWSLIESGIRFERLKVHNNPPQRDARRYVTVQEVRELNEWEETFCFTEPLANRGTFNGIVTGQCAEILLPNKGFCNLVEINLSHFNGKNAMKLWRTAELLARANYRQTCVNLVDGILQRAWHENNEFLRLCGVGVTGVAEWEPADDPAVWRMLRDKVKRSANRMADELKLPRPKAVTTVKPSGTLSKIMDTTEGVHKPLGRYIFNNVRFSKHDPYVQELIDANYRVFQDPSSPDAVLVTFPVAYPNVKMDEVDGKFVNLEPAVVQLARYKSMMDNYVDHNCSVTISYSPDETSEIVDWLFENWGSYVGVSFLYRTDPTKTAQDLGYLYLPQQVVTKEDYEAYTATLKPLAGEEMGVQVAQSVDEEYEIDAGGECATGACPVR